MEFTTFLWGGQSWPQPPFRRLSGLVITRGSRLKAGCGQDWPP